MKQEKQTELLRTQQMLNEVNRKLLMTLGVAEVFPWKWELAEHMVWFDARPSDDPAGWEIFHNDSFPVSIDRKSTRLNSSHSRKSRMPSSA